MPIINDFDVKLDNVDGEGLPGNRRLWCYELTVPATRHRRLCLDFRGNIAATDPSNFDAKTATDHPGFQWGGVSTRRTNADRPIGPNNTTTDICLDSTDAENGTDVVAGTKIKLCFIGPADGNAGGVSFHSNTRVRINDSNRWRWQSLDNGVKDGMEIPIAGLFNDEQLPATELINSDETNVIEGADFIISEPSDPFFADMIDLSELLEADIAELDLSNIYEAPLSSLKGAKAAEVKTLNQIFKVETLGELTSHNVMQRIIKLSRLIQS